MTPEELLANAARADAELVDASKRAVLTGIMTGAGTARTQHRFKNRSGDLERSIGYRVIAETDRGARGEFFANASYASFVDAGTAPHMIYAKAARGFVGPLPRGQSRSRKASASGRLTFRLSDGTWVSTPVVRHPGTRPEGFMGNAVLACEREMELELRKGRARAAVILVGG